MITKGLNYFLTLLKEALRTHNQINNSKRASYHAAEGEKMKEQNVQLLAFQ